LADGAPWGVGNKQNQFSPDTVTCLGYVVSWGGWYGGGGGGDVVVGWGERKKKKKKCVVPELWVFPEVGKVIWCGGCKKNCKQRFVLEW